MRGFPDDSAEKISPANAGDAGESGFHPWVRKIPWRRKLRPTPVFLPGNPMDGVAWRATAHGEAIVRHDWAQAHTHVGNGTQAWFFKSYPGVCLFDCFKIFLMWTMFKVFTEFVTASCLFYVLVFCPRGMWDLNSPTRNWTHMSCIGRHNLNHWTAREVPSRRGPRSRCFYLCVQVCFWVFLKPSVMMPQQSVVSASSYPPWWSLTVNSST